jgi:hypothetical protein
VVRRTNPPQQRSKVAPAPGQGAKELAQLNERKQEETIGDPRRTARCSSGDSGPHRSVDSKLTISEQLAAPPARTANAQPASAASTFTWQAEVDELAVQRHPPTVGADATNQPQPTCPSSKPLGIAQNSWSSTISLASKAGHFP